jgi:hypothetical protein
MTISRRKKIVFALVAMSLSLVVALVILLAADLVLHARAERSAGLNRYGYRGPVVGRKQPGELRVVMLGGSTVFGYGVAWNESVPAYLEPKLQARLGRKVSVVNLGYNNEGAYSFVPNLEDFAYMDYDAIVFYEGYNDLTGDAGVNTSVYRRNSAVFRLTGYFPILPLYLDEKVMMLRNGNNLNAAYDAARSEGPTVFRPTLAQRTSAGALAAVSSMARALDAQLSKVTSDARAPLTEVSALGCSPPWVNYCESVAAAVRLGRARGDAVVVGSQPRLVLAHARDVHSRQQAMLAGMLQRNFSGDQGVVWADLSDLVDLTTPNITFDAMHLNPQANDVIAAGLVEPVVSAIAGAGIQQ